MGNLQASYEMSAEEQEQFEVQVEEDYNPISGQSALEAKLEFLQRQRRREAEDLRRKYLGPRAAHTKNENINEIRPSVVTHENQKPRLKHKVTYVFQAAAAPNEEPPNAQPANAAGGAEESAQERDNNLSSIFLEKEKIRSLITPNPDQRAKELLNVASKSQVVANGDGRSPYQGAQLRVVSVNHKQQKKDPVFQHQCNEEAQQPAQAAPAGERQKPVSSSESKKQPQATPGGGDDHDEEPPSNEYVATPGGEWQDAPAVSSSEPDNSSKQPEAAVAKSGGGYDFRQQIDRQKADQQAASLD